MSTQTPEKARGVVQVPNSSPSAPTNEDNKNDDRQRQEMRKRFYAHKFWPLISKRFYYLSESELFRAMVKGKGNLRDISLWLSENIPLNQRLQEYDAKKNKDLPSKRKVDVASLPESVTIKKTPVPEPTPTSIPPQEETAPKTSQKDYDDEDASPVKKPEKARQKRSLSSVPAAATAPDTKVQLQKPKVSILEKYRHRQQPRIDVTFQKSNISVMGDDAKRRRLVRADNIDPPNPVSPASTDSASNTSLSEKYKHKEEIKPSARYNLKPSADIDELDLLEEKIKANRRKKTKSEYVEIEDDVYSDDMSAEDNEDEFSTGLTSIDGQILDFLNKSSAEDIVEICNVNPSVAEIMISKRPFNSIYDVSEERFEEEMPEPESKRRGGPKKTLGMKIIESTAFSLKGYKAVDSLVKKCSEYGDLIAKQMERWGVKVTGEGELDMVDLGEGINLNKDDDEDDDIQTQPKRSIPYISHKPTLLAPEIELKNYQQVGINWLHLLYHNKLSCILADEMGLGKTCQVISFMAYLKATSSSQSPHLVVVPSSTLENWLREFSKFCPDMVVQAYYGSQAEREDLRYDLMESEYDVLVTTYNLATGAANDFKFLRSQKFDMIVYDEGHMLKNSNSERYNKLMRLKAGFRLLLTGTPLQNNLKELVSLLAFMLPQLFVEKREDLQGLFNKKVSVDASGDYNPLLSQQAITKAKTMMTPFVLRRKKAQVLKYLPGKKHEVIKCEMTKMQREIYDKYIQQGKQTRMERERRKTLKGKEAEAARSSPIPSSSNVMMSLRKASMHPLLFRTIYTDEILEEMTSKIIEEPQYVTANKEYILEDMQVMSDYELNALCEKFPKTIGEYALERDKWFESGKVIKLLEVINRAIAKKEKILVFSLFTQLLDILEKVLSFSSITFLRLDGQTSVDTRQDIIDRFYEDRTIPVFLLSTKAGGFGINLVAANNVVVFDQSFNPHDDKQAEDRAHRVGQTKEVLVTRLISENTIDENILMLAENKLQLDESISNEENSSKIEEKTASMVEKLLFDKP